MQNDFTYLVKQRYKYIEKIKHYETCVEEIDNKICAILLEQDKKLLEVIDKRSKNERRKVV